MNKALIVLIGSVLLINCKSPEEKKPIQETEINNPTNKVVLSSEIEWEQLNPARGDKSPKAGTVWGDRKGTVATGFLAKFVDGFSSPPHIHNVTYRALVLRGLIHNDDANAEKMWMPSGSFWTQPAGAAHITAAKGADNLIYVEIDSGPYLVKPTAEAYDNGERPINMDPSNIIWLGPNETAFIEKNNNPNKAAQMAFLWNNKDLKGYLIKLPQGFKGYIKSQGTLFKAIVIQGNPKYGIPNDPNFTVLDQGSYFSSVGESLHYITLDDNSESLIYLRTNDTFKIQSEQ